MNEVVVLQVLGFETDYLNLLKMLVAVFVGFFIGLNRQKHIVGSRTFSLICLGATIFTFVSLIHLPGFEDSTGPMRVIAQIVSGIGFLGLGVVWKYKEKIGGLTTAATIWLVASIGVLIGLTMWPEAIVATVLAKLILMSREPSSGNNDQ